MSYTRHSALHGAHARLHPVWDTVNGMVVPATFKLADTDPNILAVADVSFLRKFGVKGPGASDWLSRHGVQPPQVPFDIAPLTTAGGLVARIGRAEFFLEAGISDSAILPAVFARDRAPSLTAHPMPRHDAAILVAGARVPDLLAQTCGVDVIREAPNRVVLTRFAAVSAMLLYRPDPMRLRIWCDASFGQYLWQALLDIAKDLGGGPVGVDIVGSY